VTRVVVAALVGAVLGAAAVLALGPASRAVANAGGVTERQGERIANALEVIARGCRR